MMEIIYKGRYGLGLLCSQGDTEMWVITFADGSKTVAALDEVEIVFESVA